MKKASFIGSRRDRNLLMVLAVAIVFYLCYTFIITPALDQKAILDMELEAVTAELERAEAAIAGLPELEKQAKALNKELEQKYKVFFPELDQARILYQMDTLMINSGFDASSFIPSSAVATAVLIEQGSYLPLSYPLLDIASRINPDLAGSAAASQEGTPAEATGESGDMIPEMNITISFNDADFESINGFLAAVEGMNKTVVLRNVSIAEETDGLQGQLLLSLYALPRLNDAENGYLEFTPVIPQGKPSPFN